MVVHASIQHLFLVARHGVGRQGNDGQAVEGGVLANLPRGGVAVHHGHLAVHQHPVKVRVLGQDAQGFLAVVGQHYGHARLAE